MDESLEEIFELSLESVSCCLVLVCGVTYAGTGSVMLSSISVELIFSLCFSFRFLLGASHSLALVILCLQKALSQNLNQLLDMSRQLLQQSSVAVALGTGSPLNGNNMFLWSNLLFFRLLSI